MRKDGVSRWTQAPMVDGRRCRVASFAVAIVDQIKGVNGKTLGGHPSSGEY